MKFLVLVIHLIVCSPLWACMWDTDTLRDEYGKNRTVYDLIVGQFPHHGTKYYEARVKLLLGKDRLTVLEQHDLGVGYVRLGDFDRAKVVFHSLHDDHPDSYEVNSNLGVMYKKMGDFEKAYHFIKRALEIKPEGHMGLGDWYLKRIEYELREEDSEILNFLGMKYLEDEDIYKYDKNFIFDDSMKMIRRGLIEISNDEVNMMLERVRLLIHNDYKFADAYVVLGDLLMRRGDKHMAVRSFMRAKQLGHNQTDIIDERINEIHEHWADIQSGYDGFVYDKNKEELWSDFKIELEKVNGWSEAFEKEESKLVAEGSFPSFEETLSKMSMKKIEPVGTAFFEKGFLMRVANRPFVIFFGCIFLIVIMWFRGWLKERRKRANQACPT